MAQTLTTLVDLNPPTEASTERYERGATACHSMGTSGGTATPPPPVHCRPESLPAEEKKVGALNSDGIFADTNFLKVSSSGSALPNERGRGAFAAALLCLLERHKVVTGHVHVVRGLNFDRWFLNRMPGRTNTCLLFVNNIFVSTLGLKPFPSWRSLARSLGDSREYLPPRHWTCLNLMGGGTMSSTAQPWQAYAALAGHFDLMATELEYFILCDGSQSGSSVPLRYEPAQQFGRGEKRARWEQTVQEGVAGVVSDEKYTGPAESARAGGVVVNQARPERSKIFEAGLGLRQTSLRAEIAKLNERELIHDAWEDTDAVPLRCTSLDELKATLRQRWLRCLDAPVCAQQTTCSRSRQKPPEATLNSVSNHAKVWQVRKQPKHTHLRRPVSASAASAVVLLATPSAKPVELMRVHEPVQSPAVMLLAAPAASSRNM